MAALGRRPDRRVWYVLLAAGSLATLAGLWAIVHHFVLSLHYADSDFFNFWLGAHLIVTGQDPYNPAVWLSGHDQFGATWVPDSAYIHPLPLAILMAPLGLMAVLPAYVSWILVTCAMIIAASLLVYGVRFRRQDIAFAVPWLAAVLLFRPVIVTLRNGQLGGVMLLALALACSQSKGRSPWMAGVALSLLSLKPSLGLPILVLLGLWVLVQRRWVMLAGLSIGLAILFFMGWLADPNWLFRLGGRGSSKLLASLGAFPTAWGLGTALCAGRGTCAWWAGAGLSGAALLAFGAAVYIKRSSLETWGAASLAVPVALFASPYVGAYDLLLLLLPIGVSLRRLRVRGTPYLIVASLPIWIDLASLIFVLVAARIGLDLWSSTLDLLTLTLVWWALELPPFD